MSSRETWATEATSATAGISPDCAFGSFPVDFDRKVYRQQSPQTDVDPQKCYTMHEGPLRRTAPQHWEGMVNVRKGPEAALDIKGGMRTFAAGAKKSMRVTKEEVRLIRDKDVLGKVI